MTRWAQLAHLAHRRDGRADRSDEGGYITVMTAILLFVFVGFSAFAVDVGNWYLVGQQEQRAADAAAMAGASYLPSDGDLAFSTAQTYSKINGFETGVKSTTVTPSLDNASTRLRVTVSRNVKNFFGSLLGVPNTTVGRSAVADYSQPVPMGSPCNAFGNDPDPTGNRSANCTAATQFWANIGSLGQSKTSGDAYQDTGCSSSIDGCSGSTNTDLDPNGYVYTVTVNQTVSSLHIQVFDPAQIPVGDHCDASTDKANLGTASTPGSAAALGGNADVGDANVRYVAGDGAWCTGDRNGGTTNVLNTTRFTVHGLGTNPWDPVNWPLQANCGGVGNANPKDYQPFEGVLSKALDHSLTPWGAAGKYQPTVAANFRRWVDLCTISGPVLPGTYAVQVTTSVAGGAGGHNRFALRAFGSGSDKDSISVAGFNKMAIFANFSGTTQFHLARVPSTAQGQMLRVRLFDVGDGATSGTITVLKPAEAPASSAFTGCTATGSIPALNASLPSCALTVSSSNQGRWQNIAVPIPSTYSCSDSLSTGCWVLLKYDYTGSPADATSWTASIEGDPVRLLE